MSDDKLTTTEIQKATATRATLYRFLSRGFSLEVDEPFLDWLIKLQPGVAQLARESDDKEFAEGSALLGKFAAEVKADFAKDKGAFLLDLAAEYASLFLNVGSKPVHLVESVYLGKDHLLYEDPYFDAVRIYQMFSFKKRASFREPDDHISIELEFMAHLCDFTVKSLEKGKTEYAAGYLNNQKEFLEDHLGKWASELGDRLKDSTKNRFYLSLAYLLQGFVAADQMLVPQLHDSLGGKASHEGKKPKGRAA